MRTIDWERDLDTMLGFLDGSDTTLATREQIGAMVRDLRTEAAREAIASMLHENAEQIADARTFIRNTQDFGRCGAEAIARLCVLVSIFDRMAAKGASHA